MEKIINTLLAFFICCSSFSQIDSTSTIEKSAFKKSLVLPAGLAISSLLLIEPTTKQNLQNQILSNVDSSFHTKIDDYFQYVPVAGMYLADMLKIPAKNNWKAQSKNLFLSQFSTAVIVLTLKKSLNITRPDGTPESFPSGHTSRAFVSSQVLYQEFKDSKKLLAYSGYLFSTSTGVMRVLNNRHWVPDVLMGAGIAIGITNLVYYVNPLKSWKIFQEKETKTSFKVIPVYNSDYTGASFSYLF